MQASTAKSLYICHSYQIQPNIAFNTRNEANADRFEYFDELLQPHRFNNQDLLHFFLPI